MNILFLRTNSIYFQIFLLLFFFSYSCVSLKIELPEDPDEIIDYIAVLRSIDENIDFSKPVKDENVSIKDKNIFSLVKVLNISNTGSLKWFWYDPGKKLVKSSSPSMINKDGKYLEYFIAWDEIGKDLFFKKKGKWSVVIKLNGKFLGKKDFIIK
ncbi:MAG: hypothetical protein ABFR75_03200 [Acidobacteriota bacterium]